MTKPYTKRQGVAYRAIYDRLHWTLDEIVADPQAPEDLRAAIIEADAVLHRRLAGALRPTTRACLETAILDQTTDPPGRRRAVALQALLGALVK